MFSHNFLCKSTSRVYLIVIRVIIFRAESHSGWTTILHGSFIFLCILRAQVVTGFVPNCDFQDINTVNSLGLQWQHLPSEQMTDVFTFQYGKDDVFHWAKSHVGLPSIHYKRLRYPELRVFLAVIQTHYICSICLGYSLSLPWQLEGKGNQSDHKAHTAYCFVSDKILCLWPGSLTSSPSIHETMTG